MAIDPWAAAAPVGSAPTPPPGSGVPTAPPLNARAPGGGEAGYFPVGYGGTGYKGSNQQLGGGWNTGGGGCIAEIREHVERRHWEDGKPVLTRSTRVGGKLTEISAEITRRKTRKKGHATPLEAMRAYVARKEGDVDRALEELERRRQELIDARAQLKKMA